MALITAADVRRKVQTALDDTDLTAIIAEEEAALVARLGAHGDGVTPITEIARRSGGSVWLKRPAVSVTSLSEAPYGGATFTTIDATSYYTYPMQGRIDVYPASISDTDESRIVSVVYVPADDQAARKRVLTELVRLALEQTAMRQESVAGEYSYTAPDWDVQRAKLYRSLHYFEV